MPLTKEQERALRRYSGQGASEINEALREGHTLQSNLHQEITQIDAAIDAAKTSSILVLYRGVGKNYVNALKQQGLRKGDIIEDAAFVSTSANLSVAREFQSFEPPGLAFRIRVKPGCAALDLKPFSQYPAEDEWLLPRNTRLMVTGYDKDKNILEVETI